MKHIRFAALLLATGAMLAACTGKPQAPAVAPAPPAPSPEKPVASILDLMAGQVDPAADFIWESVATIITSKGRVEQQPRTDDEWLAVRSKALQLAEAANLLMTPGRRLAHEGQKLDDEGTPGNLSSDQAQAAIDGNRDTFLAFASALRTSAEHTLAAIDKRDLEMYLKAGGEIDEACEGCHLRFWYPEETAPAVVAR